MGDGSDASGSRSRRWRRVRASCRGPPSTSGPTGRRGGADRAHRRGGLEDAARRFEDLEKCGQRFDSATRAIASSPPRPPTKSLRPSLRPVTNAVRRRPRMPLLEGQQTGSRRRRSVAEPKTQANGCLIEIRACPVDDPGSDGCRARARFGPPVDVITDDHCQRAALQHATCASGCTRQGAETRKEPSRPRA